MRKVTLTSCLAFALAVSAFAGPIAMEKNVAPVPEACTWTGPYVGLNGGIGWQDSRFIDQNFSGYEGPYYEGGTSPTWDNVNYVVGGQIGYNYQWRDLVIGIEADADYSGNSINKSRLATFGDGETRPENWGWYDHAKIDFQGSVRGRLGISLLDNKALIYMTGGVAFVHGDWSEYAAYYTADESAYYDIAWKGDDWRWGLIGGVGLEYKLNCHWSIKAEGLYTWLAEDEESPSFTGTYFVGDPAKFVFADELYSFRVGVNYNFGSFFGH